MNLHQYAKNQTLSSFCNRNIVNLHILQSNWSRSFWPISQEPDFCEVWDLCKNTANIIKLLYRLILEYVITKFSDKFKNPVFGPFWVQFYKFQGKKKISWKIRLCHTQFLMGFQHYAKRQTERQKDRRTDGRTMSPILQDASGYRRELKNI